MNTSLIATALNNAFLTSESAWESFKSFTNDVVATVTKGATEAAKFTMSVIGAIGAIAWWLVTLPLNIAITIIFYTMVYFMQDSIKEAMEAADEELAFENAVCVN